MSGAPVSDHRRAARRAIAVQEFFQATTDEQRRQLVGAFVDLLLSSPHTEPAGSARPPGVGDRRMQHEATPSPTKSRRRFEEDGPRDELTTPDA